MKTNQNYHGLPLVAVTLFFLFSGINSARATTTDWTGAVSTAWSLSLNWTAGVPTSSVDALIDNSTPGYTQDPTLDATGLAAKSVTINGSATLNGALSTDLTISGILTGSGTLSAGASTIYISGDMVVSVFNAGTSTLVLNGSTQSIGGYTFSNLTIASGTTSFATSIVVNGVLSISSSAELTPGASNTVTGSGTLTGSGIIDVTNIGSGDNFGNQYGMTTQTLTNLTVNYIGTSAQEIGANTFGSVSIANSSGVSATGTITIGQNLTLTSGNFSAGTQTINIAGNITGNGTNFSAGSGTVVLNGASAQSITGTTFYNLTIDNTSGGVTSVSQGSSTVGGTLTLTNGIWTTDGSDVLILSSATPYSGGSNSSFVDGPVQNNALSGTNTSFVFPTGNINKYAPIGLSSVASTATFTVQYFKSQHTASTTGILGSNPTASSDEYWTLIENSGSSAASVTLYWLDGSYSGITDPADLTVYYTTSTPWTDLGSSGYTGSSSSGTVTASVPAGDMDPTFGYYTFGDDNGVNPLPVSLVSFSAQYQDNQVNLNWATASEQNNAYFDIERSTDANNWANIGQVQGQGTSNVMNNYIFVDNLEGVVPSGTLYYRLKQVDFNGDFAYSMIRSVDINNPAPTVSTYPNPTTSVLYVNWTSNSDANSTLKLINATGVSVYEQIISGKGVVQKQIDMSTLPSGLYFVQLIDGTSNTVTNQSIVKN